MGLSVTGLICVTVWRVTALLLLLGICHIEAQSVTHLILVDAETDVDIRTLENGETLDTQLLPPFAIRANISGGPLHMVKFNFRSGFFSLLTYSSDYSPPFALPSDTSGNFSSWNAPAGPVELTVTPYYYSTNPNITELQEGASLAMKVWVQGAAVALESSGGGLSAGWVVAIVVLCVFFVAMVAMVVVMVFMWKKMSFLASFAERRLSKKERGHGEVELGRPDYRGSVVPSHENSGTNFSSIAVKNQQEGTFSYHGGPPSSSKQSSQSGSPYSSQIEQPDPPKRKLPPGASPIFVAQSPRAVNRTATQGQPPLPTQRAMNRSATQGQSSQQPFVPPTKQTQPFNAPFKQSQPFNAPAKQSQPFNAPVKQSQTFNAPAKQSTPAMKQSAAPVSAPGYHQGTSPYSPAVQPRKLPVGAQPIFGIPSGPKTKIATLKKTTHREAAPKEGYVTTSTNPTLELPCYRCDEDESTMECVDCYSYFCEQCCHELHGKGQWMSHEIYPLYE